MTAADPRCTPTAPAAFVSSFLRHIRLLSTALHSRIESASLSPSFILSSGRVSLRENLVAKFWAYVGNNERVGDG